MNATLALSIVPILSVLTVSLTWANPAMLPDHPGHPMSDLRDPVNNMPLANDPGRNIWTGTAALDKAAVSHDEASVQELGSDPNMSHEGAGALPQFKGYPDYNIDPPVKEATNPNK